MFELFEDMFHFQKAAPADVAEPSAEPGPSADMPTVLVSADGDDEDTPQDVSDTVNGSGDGA